MEIKWYWPAEQLGLVQDLRELCDDGTTWQVSARAGEVFFGIHLTLVLLLLAGIFFLRFFSTSGKAEKRAHTVQRVLIAVLLIRAVLVMAGIGPYFQFYPTGGGFFDLTLLEHILSGILWGFLALAVFLVGTLGRFAGRNIRKKNMQKGKPLDEA